MSHEGLRNNKAIFLDRDGTINVDKHYIYRITDFEFIPDAIQALQLLQQAGYLLIIISNQSGIARGYYTEDDYHNLNGWMIKTLSEEYGVRITDTYYCPHLPTSHEGTITEGYRVDCDCRKPRLGLFERAISEYDISIENSWAIGDKIRDLSICESTGCHGILVNNTEEESVRMAVQEGKYRNVFYEPDLLRAAERIVRA